MPDRPDLFDDIFGLPDDDFAGMPRQARKPHPMPCPPLVVLMAYADDRDTSLTPRRRQRIREHVHCCEKCFMHVERAFSEELRGVHDWLKAEYDSHQKATRRLESRFQHALHAQVKETAPPLGSPYPFRQSLPFAAATLAAIVIGLLLFRPAAAVIHAEELIERAIAYEREHTVGSRQRVRQTFNTNTGMIALGRVASGTSSATDTPRMTSFSVVRDVVDGLYSAEMRLVRASDREAHVELARLFAKYQFDSGRPFCVTCYSAWRASLPRKRDTLTLTGDTYLLRTTAFEGDLREVMLSFDRDSYRLVRQALLFEGLGVIVVEELAHQAAPAQQRLSASRAMDTVVVAPSVTSRPPAAGDHARKAARQPSLSRWLDRTFLPSASAARSTFLPDVERRSSAVRQHLIVLQRLANISESAKLKNGTDADRAKLAQQVELEYQAMVTHLRELEIRLMLLLGPGGRSLESRTPVPTDWQYRVSTALPHATRLQHRLRRIFTFDDLPHEETQPSRPRSARAAFEALWESVHGARPN